MVTLPMLEIGAGEQVVKLRGRIDRIDLLETPTGRFFRVIDYKTGTVPSLAQVKKGEMLQLVLYAMAVEKLMLGDDDARPAGVGYWGLKKEGYKEFTFADWQQLKQELEAHVLSVVVASGGASLPWIPGKRDARAIAISGRSAGYARSAWPANGVMRKKSSTRHSSPPRSWSAGSDTSKQSGTENPVVADRESAS